MPDERNRINDRFKELQREIAELRKKLIIVNNEKETWFKRKEELKKSIANSITEAKKLREEKDKINAQVKELKEKRDKQNSVTKEKINKFKGLKEKTNPKDKKRSADEIKSEIERAEKKIETEALKFSDEKKLMKMIAKLKQEYEKTKNESVAFDTATKVGSEIEESKKTAEEIHKQVQELAEQSKKKHDSYLEISKKIKEINAEQETAFNNFLKFKEEFNDLSKKADEKLGELNGVKSKLDEFKSDDKKEKDEIKKKILEKKAGDVEEKLKKGEKITTEDLIRFQGTTD